MAPALQVTHLLAFTLTDIAPSFRIVRLSNGPTLSFRVERYSLIKDMLKSTKKARSMGMEYLTPPLLVLASFPSPGPDIPPHLPLVMKAFQSLFPSLSPQNLTLSSARRVVLVAYNPERGTIDFRHYIITVKPYGVSKRVRRVLEGVSSKGSSSHVLDLGNEKDVADFLLRQRGEPGPDGYESASSAESVAGDDGDAVNLADDYVGRNNKKGQRRAVRLDEVGPRMELRLVKITEGVPGKEGAVMYHEFGECPLSILEIGSYVALVRKSKKEAAEQKAAHAAKEKLRKQRREEQERNVARKKAEKDKGKKMADEDEDEEMEGYESGEEFDDEGEWDEEEEISEGEDSEAEESSEDEQEQPPRPTKKVRIKDR